LLPDIVDEGAYLGAIRTEVPGGSTADGWSWIAGETWSYTHWAPGEPNQPFENYLAIWLDGSIAERPRGGWNNAESFGGPFLAGYVIEWDTPEPSLYLNVLVLSALLLGTRKLC
jgi:hypothetical protein